MPPPRSQGADDEGQRGGVVRLPVELFQKYASQLGRMATETSIMKAHTMFWDDHGGKPAEGTPDYQLAAQLLQNNTKRARGEVPAEGFADQVEALISESFGL